MKFYTLKEVADALGTNYMQVYFYASHCRKCNKSITNKEMNKKCRCKNSEPYLKSVNIAKGKERAYYRVSEEALNEFLAEREVKCQK